MICTRLRIRWIIKGGYYPPLFLIVFIECRLSESELSASIPTCNDPFFLGFNMIRSMSSSVPPCQVRFLTWNHPFLSMAASVQIERWSGKVMKMLISMMGTVLKLAVAIMLLVVEGFLARVMEWWRSWWWRKVVARHDESPSGGLTCDKYFCDSKDGTTPTTRLDLHLRITCYFSHPQRAYKRRWWEINSNSIPKSNYFQKSIQVSLDGSNGYFSRGWGNEGV